MHSQARWHDELTGTVDFFEGPPAHLFDDSFFFVGLMQGCEVDAGYPVEQERLIQKKKRAIAH
ncbi:hypothetical protein D3C75_1251810 [compost metagenome]